MGLDQHMGLYDPATQHIAADDAEAVSDLLYWRKNYVMRDWIREHVPGYVDNGVTALGDDDVRDMVAGLKALAADPESHTVETPECWYRSFVGTAVDGDEVRDQAREAADDIEREIVPYLGHGKCAAYWEWY